MKLFSKNGELRAQASERSFSNVMADRHGKWLPHPHEEGRVAFVYNFPENLQIALKLDTGGAYTSVPFTMIIHSGDYLEVERK